AEAADKTLALYFENASVEVSVSATAQFDAPKVDLAVEEVSNVAFENGVIYSSSIVVYNQAGQVVATASDEFAINTLKAGIYFAKTAEGSISFVVK
ncbi:MAG: T9SS type A sorting domain-containing protein, partial [Bacteroidales bacterium]|nr:T9SS type A sorting domain-containing protein [Bacteroidales bacterium]